MRDDKKQNGVRSVCRLTLRASQYRNCSAVAREHLLQRGMSLAAANAAAGGGGESRREISYRRKVPRLKLAGHSLRVAASTPVGTRLHAFQWELADESERVALARDFEAGSESELQLFVSGPGAPVCSRPEPYFVLLPGAPRVPTTYASLSECLFGFLIEFLSSGSSTLEYISQVH